MAITSNIY